MDIFDWVSEILDNGPHLIISNIFSDIVGDVFKPEESSNTSRDKKIRTPDKDNKLQIIIEE